jgi:hypothetical protein
MPLIVDSRSYYDVLKRSYLKEMKAFVCKMLNSSYEIEVQYHCRWYSCSVAVWSTASFTNVVERVQKLVSGF